MRKQLENTQLKTTGATFASTNNGKANLKQF